MAKMESLEVQLIQATVETAAVAVAVGPLALTEETAEKKGKKGKTEAAALVGRGDLPAKLLVAWAISLSAA
jgi:hypothetical protein